MTALTDLQAALPGKTINQTDGGGFEFLPNLTQDEWNNIVEPILVPDRYRVRKARLNAAAIPNWATWTEAQAQTWGMANIGQPLIDGRANLPASLTLATARAAILQIITILDAMWAMQWAMARMIIALRDDRWDLSG